MDKSNLEVMKELFSNSSEKTFFTDYDFNVLWCGDSESEPLAGIIETEGLFSETELPLKSGQYSIVHDGHTLDCRVINYSECEIYVLQFNKNDTLSSFMNQKIIQKFLINSTGAIRQAITGITVSNNMLSKTLEQLNLKDSSGHSDIITGNCLKVLKLVMNVNELVRYADGSIEKVNINATEILKKLCEICRSILDQKAAAKSRIGKELFIYADPERFIACMLSMIVFVSGRDKLKNSISLTAERKDGKVVITAEAKGGGNPPGKKTFSSPETLYNDDEVNFDMLIIKRFCTEFGGHFETSEDKKTKKACIELPFCECGQAVCNSPAFSYPYDQFSKYHIAFSDILY